MSLFSNLRARIVLVAGVSALGAIAVLGLRFSLSEKQLRSFCADVASMMEETKAGEARLQTLASSADLDWEISNNRIHIDHPRGASACSVDLSTRRVFWDPWYE